MKLLNQLRDDAGKLAEEAIPEVSTAVEQLASGSSLAKVVIALVARLEQDVAGLVHPAATSLPSTLTTPVEDDATAEAAAQVQPTAGAPGTAPLGQVPPAAPAAPVPNAELAQLQAELAGLRQQATADEAKIAALQSAQTPAAVAAPVVNQEVVSS